MENGKRGKYLINRSIVRAEEVEADGNWIDAFGVRPIPEESDSAARIA